MTDHKHASEGRHQDQDSGGSSLKPYGRLLAMVLTSTAFMYFFMYWNIYRLSDFWLSETRFYMSVMMFGLMLAIMLAYMLHMYKSRTVNIALFAASGVLMVLGIWLVRSQVTVQDGSWMKSMIPHHSIAIMVSERAEITDPRARKLADEIIAAQEKEIAEMEYLIRKLDEDGEVDASYPLGEREAPVVSSVAAALASPSVSTLDVGGMTDEEVARAVPDAACSFRFSDGQAALLAVSDGGQGVVKLMGNLVPVSVSGGAVREAPTVTADGLRLTVERLDGQAFALVLDLDVGEPLRVGYDGVYECAA